MVSLIALLLLLWPETIEASATSPQPALPTKVSAPPIPAGTFTLDATHASLFLSVDHLGISNYRMRFSKFDVALTLDPAKPTTATAVVTVDANSLALENPPPGFREELLGKNWINAVTHPKIMFKTSRIDMRGPAMAQVSGDLTLNGVTKPVKMFVKYNGGYADHPMDPGPRIGFSGNGSFKRSDFGIKAGIPAPGSKMGVGDEVSFTFEIEMKGKAG